MAELARKAGVSLVTAYRWRRGAVQAHPGNEKRLAAAAKRLGIERTVAGA